MVGPYEEFVPFEIESLLEDSPDDGKAFFLGSRVVPFCGIETSTPIPNRVSSVGLFLEQTIPDLVARCIGIENEFPIAFGQR